MIDEKKLLTQIAIKMNRNRYDSHMDEWNVGLEQAQELIYEQPKVGEWIPCSERLPIKELESAMTERGKNAIYPVIATARVLSYEETKHIIIVRQAWYMEHEGRKYFSDTECNEVEVIAWQPLPEPYKGD